jgi:hypothetical protein
MKRRKEEVPTQYATVGTSRHDRMGLTKLGTKLNAEGRIMKT